MNTKDATTDERCGCDRGMMIAVTPMHPKRYLDLACPSHRAAFVAASPYWAAYAETLTSPPPSPGLETPK